MDNENDKNNKLAQEYLVSEALNQKIKETVEQYQQQYKSKFEEELKKNKKETNDKLEAEIINIKKQYENQFFTKPNWFWGLIITGLFFTCIFLIRYVFDKSQENYYKLLNEKTEKYDLKIKYLEYQIDLLKKPNN